MHARLLHLIFTIELTSQQSAPYPTKSLFKFLHVITMHDDGFVVLEVAQSQQPEMPSIFHLPKLNGHDLFETTVDELQHLYSSNAFTAAQYTQFCLDRIQAVNPYLESVIEPNPCALDIAKNLDLERGSGKVRGPLHGIPVLVKDVGPPNFFASFSIFFH